MLWRLRPDNLRHEKTRNSALNCIFSVPLVKLLSDMVGSIAGVRELISLARGINAEQRMWSARRLGSRSESLLFCVLQQSNTEKAMALLLAALRRARLSSSSSAILRSIALRALQSSSFASYASAFPKRDRRPSSKVGEKSDGGARNHPSPPSSAPRFSSPSAPSAANGSSNFNAGASGSSFRLSRGDGDKGGRRGGRRGPERAPDTRPFEEVQYPSHSNVQFEHVHHFFCYSYHLSLQCCILFRLFVWFYVAYECDFAFVHSQIRRFINKRHARPRPIDAATAVENLAAKISSLERAARDLSLSAAGASNHSQSEPSSRSSSLQSLPDASASASASAVSSSSSSSSSSLPPLDPLSSEEALALQEQWAALQKEAHRSLRAADSIRVFDAFQKVFILCSFLRFWHCVGRPIEFSNQRMCKLYAAFLSVWIASPPYQNAIMLTKC
jgi:hypothetical protein